MTAHSELVARLEGASEGSMELDELVALETTHPYGVDAVDWDGFPAYTTSLDAALALAERVLPGWWVEIKQRHLSGESPRQKWSAEVEWPEPIIIQSYGETLTSHEFYHAFAPTPALALCIAVLRAKGAEQ